MALITEDISIADKPTLDEVKRLLLNGANGFKTAQAKSIFTDASSPYTDYSNKITTTIYGKGIAYIQWCSTCSNWRKDGVVDIYSRVPLIYVDNNTTRLGTGIVMEEREASKETTSDFRQYGIIVAFFNEQLKIEQLCGVVASKQQVQNTFCFVNYALY